MRDVLLSVDGRKVGLCQKAEIHSEWEPIEFPLYRDSSTTRTIRTLQKIRVILEKVYQEKEDFFDNLPETDLEFTLTAGQETHTISDAQIIDYRLEGGLDGELIERVVLVAENYS
jgi:hypothetical protein